MPDELKKIKKEMDEVGCGFCLAKWTQASIHFQLGRTHSCHHPDTHIIPLNELSKNPSALHNTKFKKQQRKDMLEGRRPSECSYCWGVEDNSKEFSDRIFKSSEPWSWSEFQNIKNSNWRDDYNPRYVEVSFSNACNFKCSYCGPSFSSKWVKEIEKYGSYPTSNKYNNLEWLKMEDKFPFNPSCYNPYIESFWKWWPELYRSLHTFRITGGEPLLSKDTWNILDFIINENNPNKNLHLAINTNLGVTDSLINKLIDKINKIADEKRVNDIVIFTSVDGWGEQAAYGRYGLIFNKFWDNINKILIKCPTVTIGIMSTYNVLSIPSYLKLIHESYNLKKEYSSLDRAWSTAITLDSSYLRYPLHQSIQILPLVFAEQIKLQSDEVEKLKEVFHVNLNSHGVTYGFINNEIGKIKRIYDWMIIPQDASVQLQNRHDFYKFINEHDKRRGTNFLKTFPEYEDFFQSCKI